MRRRSHDLPENHEVYERHVYRVGRTRASAGVHGGVPLLRKDSVLPGTRGDFLLPVRRLRGGNLRMSLFSIIRRGIKAAPWDGAAGRFCLENFVFCHTKWREILKSEEVHEVKQRGYVYLYAMNKAGRLYRVAWTHKVIAGGGNHDNV